MSATTLTSSPAARVLRELLAAASQSDAEFSEHVAGLRPEELPPRDSKEFFAVARNAYLSVSADKGNLLYVLARARQVRFVVEFGTSFGISTIYLASAVRDAERGGLVIGTELERNKVDAARRNLAAAGLDDVAQIRHGDALATLGDGPPDTIDMLFLDGAKGMYLDVLKLLEPRLAPGALVVADNANLSRVQPFLDHVRSSDRYVAAAAGTEMMAAIRV